MNRKELETAQQKFKDRQLSENKEYFESLAKGQTPSFFVLACCDSRTDPSTVTGQPLGELFIHRNIANQASQEDEGFQASLYYALHVLKVDYVLVLGHTHCGGVQGTKTASHPEPLENWISPIRDTLSLFEGKAPEDGETLERFNVVKQVENIKHQNVFTSAEREVPVLGALFHIENGTMEWVDIPPES
ncbi:carbonic anhydrase [Alkalicoccus halolimnae]|uniref:carbonic anhydrase n=1 Tax=Alkalicoccus halolimnae TaxID=1667239 RepID=A0AAJ8N3L4_9BACI|nr:carbonic anhydrase [Alkalicoccus halolimnae]